MVQEIDVEVSRVFSNFWFEMARVVVVGLDLKIRARSRRVSSEPEEFSSRQF